jgi:hypothetical protein
MTTNVAPDALPAPGKRASASVRRAAVVVAGFLAAYAVYQLALVAGAPLGRAAWGGTHTTLPANLRVGSAIAVLVYLAFAAVVVRRVGFQVRWISRSAARRGTWAVAVILTLSALVNVLSESPWERFLNGPVTLALAALCFLVAKRGGDTVIVKSS